MTVRRRDPLPGPASPRPILGDVAGRSPIPTVTIRDELIDGMKSGREGKKEEECREHFHGGRAYS